MTLGYALVITKCVIVWKCYVSGARICGVLAILCEVITA